MTSKQIVNIECYIHRVPLRVASGCEERLHVKESNKCVVLVDVSESFNSKLSTLLSQAKKNRGMFPTVYRRDGMDTVVVSGVITAESESLVYVNVGVVGSDVRLDHLNF